MTAHFQCFGPEIDGNGNYETTFKKIGPPTLYFTERSLLIQNKLDTTLYNFPGSIFKAPYIVWE